MQNGSMIFDARFFSLGLRRRRQHQAPPSTHGDTLSVADASNATPGGGLASNRSSVVNLAIAENGEGEAGGAGAGNGDVVREEEVAA